MTDTQLQKEVLAELEFEPEVHPERIGVSVQNGVVTLSGQVESCSQKLAAERVVKRVYSVKALVDALEVHLPARDGISDEELASAALSTIAQLGGSLRDAIRITVRDGYLILEGELDWQYQRLLAEDAVGRLQGVRGVRNHIAVYPPVTSTNVRRQIEASVRRSMGEMGDLDVRCDDGRVILSGTVPSLEIGERVEQAAWRAAGVAAVENCLVVGAET